MADHPTQDKLAEFLLGRLQPGAIESVADHIDHCPPCQQTLTQLERHKDTLLMGLKQPPPPVDAECEQVVSQVAKMALPGARPAQSPLAKESQTESLTNSTAALSREQFIAGLLESAVLDQSEWQQLLATHPPIAAATDSLSLARALMQQGTLTRFQAQILLRGKGKSLRFGDYVVLEKLGEGGMGQVFKARHRRMDRLVALKVMSSTALKDPEAVKRFQREAKAAAKLVHPNIVTAFDAGEFGKVHYLVMEFVDGHDLSGYVKHHGPLGLAEAVAAILQAAKGLAFAHAEGVVHRDIKPANLLRDKKGVVRVLDMGLARIDNPLGKGQDEGLTQSGAVMGTVDYMAPEQAFNTRDAGPAADVYSLGCTLFALLTGSKLYDGETMIEKILAHREKPIPKLTSSSGKVPAPLAQLFEKMVAKQVPDRPTMEQVVAALEPLKGKLPAAKPKPVVAAPVAVDINQKTAAFIKAESGERKAAGRKISPWKWLVATGLAAVLAAYGIWVIVTDKDGKELARLHVPEGVTATIQPDEPKPEETKKGPVATPPTEPSLDPKPPTSPGTTETPKTSEPTVPTIPTTPVKFTSPYVLQFDGDDRVEIPTLKYDGSHDLTVEVVWGTKNGSTGTIIGDYVKDARGPVLSDGIMLKCYGKNSTSAFIAFKTQGHAVFIAKHPDAADGYHHFALVIGNNRQAVYYDGHITRELSFDRAVQFSASAKHWLIGNYWTHENEKGFNGDILAIRLSKSQRYKTEFSPPTELGSDAETIAVYRFEEGSGDVLKDSSGNNHHGKIVGAKWAATKSAEVATVGVPVVPTPPETKTTLSLPSNATAPNLLEFDGKSCIDIPNFEYDGSTPLTFEARLSDSAPQTRGALSHKLFDVAHVTSSGFYKAEIGLITSGIDASKETAAIHANCGNTATRRIHARGSRPLASDLIDLAVVFEGTKTTVFANGKRSPHGMWDYPTSVPKTEGTRARIGGWAEMAPPLKNGYCGVIEQVRISKTARYKANYTPAKTLEPDADTYVLYKFDEGSGDIVKDSSGHNLHGKIVGAKWVKIDASSATTNAPSGPTNSVPSPAVGTSPALVRSNDQLAAEWVVSIGGKVTVKNAAGKRIKASSGTSLPSEDYWVEAIDLFQNRNFNKGDLQKLRGLAELNYINLNFTRTGDEDVAHLATCPKLEHLDLSATEVTPAVLASLKLCTNLKKLILEWGGASRLETLDGLETLASLDTLQIGRGLVSDELAASVGKLTQIRKLYAANSSISDAGVGHWGALAQLDELHLSGTPISDATEKTLAGLKSLKKLSLSKTWITSDAEARIRAALPECSVSLERDRGAAAHFLKHGGAVKYLANDQETDWLTAGMATPAGSFSVIGLRLSGIKLGLEDADLTWLRGLYQLRTLDLSNTAIKDSQLLGLERMTELRELDLRNTKLKSETIANLRQQLPSCNLLSD